MRKIRVYGNWKMNKTCSEAKLYVSNWSLSPSCGEKWECGIAPPFVAIACVSEEARRKGLRIGAQNCHFEENGAFTGEISLPMLQDLKVDFVILGHSERRLLFGEDSIFVQKKVEAALRRGINVVLCVGETLEEREGGREREVVEDMLLNSLGDRTPDELKTMITIAYEPVWAIGTGKNATPEQAAEMHAFIREVLDRRFGKGTGQEVTIQYGGSVKSDNAEELASVEEIDGFLVGGASLDVESFQDIIVKTLEVKSLK